MYIPNIPEELYISDPSQLVPGINLWSVGQGGVSKIQSPYFKGIVHSIDCSVDINGNIKPHKDWIVFQSKSEYSGKIMTHSTSMIDHHILPQTYNNWYMCDSLEKAEKIYILMQEEWNRNPEYESARLKKKKNNKYNEN